MNTHADARAMASTVPRNAREPGSPEWCYQTMNLMKHSYQSIQSDHQRFENYLDELREHRAWEKVPVESPYGSEERMLEAEIGKRTDQIEGELAKVRKMKAALVAERIDEKDRENQRPAHVHIDCDVYEEKNNVHVRPSGNSREACIRRLRKDRPDIHERVLSGELTPHGGMVEAGFRKKSPSQKLSAFERIHRLIERCADDLTEAERRQLRDLL